MYEIFAKLEELKVVPVVVIEDADDAVPLAETLIEAGLPCAEVTFRTSAGAEAIRRMAKVKGLILGAGTVLTEDQAEEATAAGAQFVITPGFNPKVVGYCIDNDIPISPGTSTPTDIEAALSFGLNIVKFFPAEAFGGVKTLKAISAPYTTMKFIPTGGVNAENLLDYLRFPKVLACGGSWMVKKDLIAAKNFGEIARMTREAVELSSQA